MSGEIIQEYKNVIFPPQIVQMFADIVKQDSVMFSVFEYIIKRYKQDGEKNFNGVSVNDIANNVKIERPVKIVRGKQIHFESQVAYIHRQTAGKVIDKLLSMSLLSYKPLTPYKYFYVTKRGLQVMSEILNRIPDDNSDKEINKEQGDELNG